MDKRRRGRDAGHTRAAGLLLLCLACAACSPAEGFQIGPVSAPDPGAAANAGVSTSPADTPARVKDIGGGAEGAGVRPVYTGDVEAILHRRLERLDPRDDRAAIRLLEVYGAAMPPRSPDAVHEMIVRLMAAVKSERAGVRRGAAAVLSRIDPAALIGDPFTGLFVDPDPSVRREAVLGRMRQGVGTVWIHVLNLSHDPDPQVRAAAATALGTVQHETVSARLVQLLSDPDAVIVSAAGFALANTLAGDVPDAILALAVSERLEVRLAVVRILAAVRGDGAAEALIAMMDDANWQVRRAAIRGLTGMGGEIGTKVTWALHGVAEHDGRSQLDRVEAVQALSRTRKRPDIDRLERMGRKESDPVLRLAIARTMLAWGDIRCIESLVELTEFATDDPAEQRLGTRVRAIADDTLRQALATRSTADAGGTPAGSKIPLVRTRTWREKLPEMVGQLTGKGVDYSPSDLNDSIW